MSSNLSNPVQSGPTVRINGEELPLVVGMWFWVRNDDGDGELLYCVTDIGSNYARLNAPGGHYWRIHFDEFEDKCREEPEYRVILRGRIEDCRRRMAGKMAEIRELTQRLGVVPRKCITDGQQSDESSRALAIVGDGTDVKDYERQLIDARDKSLPEMFKQVEEIHRELAVWMEAEMIPVQAQAGHMKGAIEVINDRIFSVSLYAGLVEDVHQVKRGQPAEIGDKLHIMQGMCYMDEECLTEYRHGGIDFTKIVDFDRWLSIKKNMHRILPFPKCMVAFQVRRFTLHREAATIAEHFINIRLADLDKMTFLYIRNGDQLYRLNSEFGFGGQLFPDREDELDFSRKMWASVRQDKVEDLITDGEREHRINRANEKIRNWEEWRSKHKKDYVSNPYGYFRPDGPGKYEPFDQSSVYYDDMVNIVNERINGYNKVSLLIQGLLDRSMVLHPHPPVRLWNPEEFASMVTLVYDRDRALHHGDPPDFESYKAACNESIGIGSIVIGQEKEWLVREAEIENDRRDRDWRSSYTSRLKTFRPYGDPGPGFLCRIVELKNGVAKFRWKRRKRRTTWRTEHVMVDDSISVPIGKLFNVSAYKPGDYKQFFADPRSRSRYHLWAETLLSAEEYHAGNMSVGDPGIVVKRKRKRRSGEEE